MKHCAIETAEMQHSQTSWSESTLLASVDKPVVDRLIATNNNIIQAACFAGLDGLFRPLKRALMVYLKQESGSELKCGHRAR